MHGKRFRHEDNIDILVPLPPKRVVWLNLYAESPTAIWRAETFPTLEAANSAGGPTRVGNRAHRIEID